MTYISIVCAIVITFISNQPITHEQYKLALIERTNTGHEEETSAIFVYTCTPRDVYAANMCTRRK